MNTSDPIHSIDRRHFLVTGASAATAIPLVSTGLLAGPRAVSPNEMLNVACVGVGGMGRSDLGSVARGKNVRIVALCDVDANRLAAAATALGKAPAKAKDGADETAKAKEFRDYRKMLDDMGKDIDAVVVSTPDHMHGSIAIAAMSLGKHVYCQKPIAHNLYECRKMAELAVDKKLVTQMGTQIHSHGAYLTAVAAIRNGAIGKVEEVHAWVSRSWAGPAKGRPVNEDGTVKTDPVPAHLDWDLWLGVAPQRPFAKGVYHPANWRGWLDFGSGTLGDMGCHIFDPVFSALGLGAPRKVVSRGPKHRAETFAPDSDIVYEFPGTDLTGDVVTLRWTDGRKASRPDAKKAQLPDKVKLPGAGSFLVGEKGVMVLPHWRIPSFYKDGEPLAVEFEKLKNRNHYHEWTDACRGEGTASTPFSYAGPLTEAVILGTVAGRFPDQEIGWDSARLNFDDEKANAFVKRSYRKGWEL